jgi:hypothetical protein
MDALSPAEMRVPWGAGFRHLAPPGRWPAFEVHAPDLAGAIEDYGAELERALDEPVGGGGRLGEGLEAGGRVAIVVDDPSRWTPVREALGVVLGRLRAAGVGDDRITISVGVGRHQAVDRSAMSRRVGAGVVERISCFSPPVDDLRAYVELGRVAGDVPVRVFGPVARADLRILIGSVLPHLQAGFGGGWKLIFPGTSHRTTLGALHRQGLEGGGAEGLLGSEMRCNPMRRVIREAAGLLPGRTISISHVLGAPGMIFRVAAGEVDAVQEALATEVRRRFAVSPEARSRVVVATNAPWPGDPMQSFKVLLNHRSACERGGALVGLFWTDPAELVRSMPLGALRGIAASGGAGGWLIRRGLTGAEGVLRLLNHPARFMVRWARELVVDRAVFILSPELRERLGRRLGPVRLHGDEGELWRDLERVVGLPERVQLYPWGGLSYVPAAGV